MFFKRDKQLAPKIVLSAPEPVAFLNHSHSENSGKILIVDDDAVTRKALSLILQSSGYQVVTATDAAEAMSQLNSEKPDLLIVDVFLAADAIGCGALGWDGFQFARWLQSSSCRSPVIIMSGVDQPEYRSQTTAAGARGFLTKPIAKTVLLAAVASLISEKSPAGLAGLSH